MSGFRLPTRVIVAPGCLGRLGEAVVSLRLRRLLLVVDPSLAATEAPHRATEALSERDVEVEEWHALEVNPRTTTAEAIAEHIRTRGCDGVAALGGGSALDVAKAAAMLATNPGPAESYTGLGRFSEPPLPFVAIPTTCGTGSEVTWVAVLTHSPTRRKISVKGEAMFPAWALVDADLVATLPPPLVASTGLDALTHALEATTGRAANAVSDALAEVAIGLLLRYLPRAVADPAGDHQAREAVTRASTLAGIAFGNADVGGVHCLSESLGGLFDLPHGLLNAVLLVPVLRHHLPSIAPRLAELDRLSCRESDPRATATSRAASFLGTVEELVCELGIPPFEALGIAPSDFPLIARLAEENGSNPSNPQPMDADGYLQILNGL